MKNLVKYRKSMIQKYTEKVQREEAYESIVNSIGEQSTLLLMAVRNCFVNKKSQAEIAKKYGTPRSRVQ